MESPHSWSDSLLFTDISTPFDEWEVTEGDENPKGTETEGTSSASSTGSSRTPPSELYTDHYMDPVVDHELIMWEKRSISEEDGQRQMPSNTPFPQSLYIMLQQTEWAGLEHIVSWNAHGRAFGIHDREEFVKQILPK